MTDTRKIRNSGNYSRCEPSRGLFRLFTVRTLMVRNGSVSNRDDSSRKFDVSGVALFANSRVPRHSEKAYFRSESEASN